MVPEKELRTLGSALLVCGSLVSLRGLDALGVLGVSTWKLTGTEDCS